MKKVVRIRVTTPASVLSAEDKSFLTGWVPASVASQKDIEGSLRAAAKVHALPKQCWFNCRRAVEGLDEFAGASYVEGWVLGENCPAYEHAWLVHNGKIIDPTLTDTSLTYFPGLEFRGRGEIEAFPRTPRGRACRKSPFFYAFGWGGQESPSFRRCYEQAQLALLGRHGVGVSQPHTHLSATGTM